MDTNRKINLAFSGGLAALGIIAVLSIVATQRLIRDANWVEHSYEVRSTLRAFDTQVREAKSEVRSFLITADSGYLRRHRLAVDSARQALKTLEQLTVDNPTQQTRLRELHRLLDERVASFERTITIGLTSDSGLTTAATRARLAEQLAAGETLSARVGAAVGTFDATEAALLDQRATSERGSEQGIRLIVIAFALCGTALAWLMRRSIQLDLEKRTRVEQALRESEAKFAGILSIAADAIISVDANQIIRHFNHGAEQIFGYSASEMIGQSLEVLLPARFTSAHRGHIEAFARADITSRRMGERRQVLGRRKNAEEFPADASISKLATSEGMLFTVVLRDVSEQKRLERHEHVLAEAGRRLVDSIEYEDVLQVVADLPVPDISDWCVVDIIDDVHERRRFRRVANQHDRSGRDGHEALHALAAVALDDDSPSRIIDVIRTKAPELIAAVDDEWIDAHAAIDEAAALRSLGVSSLLIVPLVAGERIVGVMTAGTNRPRRPLDDSELALMQAVADRATLALENARSHALAHRATAIRDEVLSVVSHDLRNPLSAVSMCARTLLEHPPASEAERQKLYRSTLDAAEWMHRLMQDLLDAASIDAGRLSIAAEPQSVLHLLEAGIHMLAPRAAIEGVTLAMEAETSVPVVNADGSRVLQVLSNLIGNAIKYSPRGATVTVGAASSDREVTIFVRDRGSGISTEHLPHIFDRFWHMRGTSRTRGTGLGLAIARGIVTAHGGRIWVKSRVDVGSTFYFTLPVVRAGVPDGSSSRSSADSLGLTRPFARTDGIESS